MSLHRGVQFWDHYHMAVFNFTQVVHLPLSQSYFYSASLPASFFLTHKFLLSLIDAPEE